MEESNVDLKCTLRMLSLTEEQMTILSGMDLTYTPGAHYKTGMPNAIFNLDKCCLKDIHAFATLAGIHSSDIDICMSFRTDYDNRLIGVPKSVNQAIKLFDCEMVINYTINYPS